MGTLITTDFVLVNISLSAVKRLMKEAKELFQPTELYYAQPLEVGHHW